MREMNRLFTRTELANALRKENVNFYTEVVWVIWLSSQSEKSLKLYQLWQ
jgi:hypothetical protein